ncbi:ABC transporter ATP-binding protein [Candidatus Uhrbacteria bacterium]|nr:ABC transporter ATP-binding protein [Candidatus Uhrbacteria bacterium]
MDPKTASVEAVTKASFRDKLEAYKFFLRVIWKANPRLAVFRFFLLILGAFLQPIEIYAFSLLITAIATGQQEKSVPLIAIVIISYGLRQLVTDATYSKVNDWFERSAGFATQIALFEHISGLDPEQLTKDEVRRKLDFVREELWRLNRLSDRTEWFLRSALKVIGSLGLALVAPWWVAVLVIVNAAIQAVNFYTESNMDLWTASWNSLEGRRFEYARYVFLMGNEFREIKLLGAAGVFLGKVRKACSVILDKFRRVAITSLLSRFFIGLLHIAAYAAVIVILGRDAFSGPEALATLYVALNLFGLMGDGLSGLSGSVSQLSSDLGILAKVHSLFRLQTESDKGLRIPDAPLTIEFKDVRFRYPGAATDALRGVNVVFREDEHLAIVGENGAGKTTFMRLLSGLDKPTSGIILLNGKPLDRYRKSEWRRVFHLLPQDAALFQDFVRDNLLYGEPPKKWNKLSFGLVKSVRIAGADTVIWDMKEGYETFLGSWVAPHDVTPHQVSGGQQQKLLIARTLIHGGRIIAFDEPTSSIDALAETTFFERLKQALGKRGLIYISHRFSTVRRAGRILVFNDGELQEQGSHEELMLQGGKYAEMYKEQAKWYV